MFTQIQAIRTGYAAQFIGAVESAGLRTGELLRLTGPAIFLDKISGNGRRYIDESVHQQVADLQPRIQKKALFGCLDHPPTDDLNALAYVKMTDVSHRIDALWYEPKEKTYYITVTILDTPNGRILKTIYDAGSPLYVSLRSLLDPGRNVQRNGYVDAWMLALITVDFVSRPGFADAELKAVDVSTEAALAVCESLNLFQQKRIFGMKSNKKQSKYVPLIAMESIAGVAVEPSEDFKTGVSAFIADVLDKLPGKFTAADFAAAYANSMFNDAIIGLYEDTAELMYKDANTVALIPLTSEVDGEFAVNGDAAVQYFDTAVQYFDTEIANAATVECDEQPEDAVEMYAVIATEDYTPTEEFIETANKVADYMRDKYSEGFTEEEFQAIADELKDMFGVVARIDKDEDQLPELKFTKGDDAASIVLELGEDVMVPKYISEYWMPGTESLDGVQQQTEGNEVPPVKNDKEYFEQSDLKGAEEVSVEIVDEDKDAEKAQQTAMQQMYQIVEDNAPAIEVIDEEPEDAAKAKTEEELHDDQAKVEAADEESGKKSKEAKEDKDSTELDQEDANANELAVEAQRLFSLPNSKFSGIYAIEHMPATHKHIWSGLSDAAKAVIAKQAVNANVATEAQCLQFWASTNFIAIERACIINSGKVEAALESFKVADPKLAFLGGRLPSAH